MKHVLLRRIFFALVAFLLLGSSNGALLAQTPVASPVASPAASPVATPATPHGIEYANMDLSVDPGSDFYQFANGGWLSSHEIPSDKPSYGVFDELSDRVDVQLAETVSGLTADPDSPEGKARSIYDQYLDTATRDQQGVTPLQPILDETVAITSIADGLVFQQQSDNVQLSGLFAVYASASPDDATVNIGNLYGPILSLPSEDYYLDDSEQGKTIRDAWVDTTAQLLMRIGYSEADATTAAQTVMTFETELVGIKTPDADLFSDPVAQNNPRTLAELQKILPSFDWQAFITKTHIPDDVNSLVVVDLPYLEHLQGVLDKADPLTLRYLFDTELMWTYASYLSPEIGDLAFAFQGPVLYGVDQRRPVEERALQAVQDQFPDTLAEAYVAKEFPPQAKAQIEALVQNLIAAFRVRIEQSTWMSDETKAKALEKLDMMVVNVGYPDSWETYDNVAIGDSLFATVLNAYDASNATSLGDIGKPVDRTDWVMSAFEVNAYYNPSVNEIVFPAGILQAPFFDPDADLASNYGSIGAVIGHEITHGFDLSGSQFDGNGNLVTWWTEADFNAFMALNDQVKTQYGALEVAPGLNVDGELTVTENVADMGGVQIAHDALLIALDAGDQQTTPWFLTQQQRFFIAYATTWREKSTPELLQVQVASDVHAPGPVRAVAPIRNMEAFYTAFDITDGDSMYLPPDQRILIW